MSVLFSFTSSFLSQLIGENTHLIVSICVDSWKLKHLCSVLAYASKGVDLAKQKENDGRNEDVDLEENDTDELSRREK